MREREGGREVNSLVIFTHQPANSIDNTHTNRERELSVHYANWITRYILNMIRPC